MVVLRDKPPADLPDQFEPEWDKDPRVLNYQVVAPRAWDRLQHRRSTT